MHNTSTSNPTHGLKKAVSGMYAWRRSAYIPGPS
jgi:hypothetical protein